ncbi:hypothetical protein AVEN_205980-1 [Araneus ventricosus]|uniref:Uncharacterized protein n=1 Tax=Araneus ventricosus TaxID=182803 RepID=A0A4Y2KTT0_ARAVE|nr:hypothetical protein AVEN_205980-1 [Araneus ventricosus]
MTTSQTKLIGDSCTEVKKQKEIIKILRATEYSRKKGVFKDNAEHYADAFQFLVDNYPSFLREITVLEYCRVERGMYTVLGIIHQDGWKPFG